MNEARSSGESGYGRTGGRIMMKRFGAAAATFALALGACASAHAFPLGFSVAGGIGAGYYSMADLNSHLNNVRQANHIKLDELGSGVNFKADARIWFYDLVAVSGGYEHLWGESVSEGSSTTLDYKTPADVYTLGLVGAVFVVPNVVDLCVGVNRCSAKAVFGTNEVVSRRLAEFTGRNVGFEAYAEVHSNFINPVEVGLQFGYRNLKIQTLYDRRSAVGFFESGDQISLDYSGFFFYLTSAIRI